MVIFRRRKHPLPKFPPNVSVTFRRLCEELPDEKIRDLLSQVELSLENFQKLSERYERLDMETVESLASTCRVLLEEYPYYSAEEKALIIGAVRYFADHEDDMSEVSFASGLDDDVRVMNHVLEAIGKHELILRL